MSAVNKLNPAACIPKLQMNRNWRLHKETCVYVYVYRLITYIHVHDVYVYIYILKNKPR